MAMTESKPRKNEEEEEVKRDRARSSVLSTKESSRSRTDGSSKNRMKTLKKKAGELETLCGAEVCIVAYGPNGDLEVWPPNPDKARDMIMKFKTKLSSGKKRKATHASDFLDAEKRKKREEKRKGFDGFEEKVVDLEKFSRALDSKIQDLDRRIEALLGQEEVEHIHIINGSASFGGGEVEGADYLAANLMGFESFAEINNNVCDIIVPPIATPSPSPNCFPLAELVHHDQQFISPFHEALPFSFWSQPLQSQIWH